MMFSKFYDWITSSKRYLKKSAFCNDVSLKTTLYMRPYKRFKTYFSILRELRICAVWNPFYLRISQVS